MCSFDSLECGLRHASSSADYAVQVDGRPARLQLSADTVSWVLGPGAAPAPAQPQHTIPLSEMLGLERLDSRVTEQSMCIGGGGPRLHALALFTFRRAPAAPHEWHPRRVLVQSPAQQIIDQLAADIGSALGPVLRGSRRPSRLLVILNSNAGNGQALAAYRSVARPVFACAGVHVEVRQTRHAGHAEQMMRCLPAAGPGTIDGVVVVGGDGAFNEVLNGVLAARAEAGPERRAALAGLRLGHLPCGSTDAVACSLHGTRSVFAAAVHAALGDAAPLDVLRVDVGGAVRFACCIATCGFMSDVVQASETYRWLGPFRYDVVGAAVLGANKSYRCRVAYMPPEAAAEALDPGPCSAACAACRRGPAGGGGPPGELEQRQEEWVVVEDAFMSVMLIVMPCLSPKTPLGMARHGHLADGVLKLVLVRRCSPLQYLSFLSTMSRAGLVPGQFPHVEVLDAVACRVESLEPDAAPLQFNLDGELVPGRAMAAEVRRGEVQVFARGVERAR